MAEGIIKYPTSQYADQMVLLPKSGYIYLKCARADMGYYILRCNTNICERLKETTRRESYVCCEEFDGGVCLTIDIIGRRWLVSNQEASHGKKMWAALVKLQRWFLWFPQKYKLEVTRRTAVAMCLHERLGVGSNLGCMGADILVMVGVCGFRK